jgi:hypothetical protein
MSGAEVNFQDTDPAKVLLRSNQRNGGKIGMYKPGGGIIGAMVNV